MIIFNISRSGGNLNTSSDIRNFNRNINWDNVLDNNYSDGVQFSQAEGGEGREGSTPDRWTHSCGACTKHSQNQRNRNRIRRGLVKLIRLAKRNMDIPPANKDAILADLQAQLEPLQRSS